MSQVHTWHVERSHPHNLHYRAITEVLAHKKTLYQEMWIVNFSLFGKALILDGYLQSATADEFVYHEPLVHPACVYHGAPKRVLVLGGGEGATIREILKWQSVEQVVMVDIDGELVDACQKHLPEMHQGAFDDPRCELVIGDALEYLAQFESEWDIIISDLSDPVEDSPAAAFFTKEYFEKCRRLLKPNGYLVVQASSCSAVELIPHARLVNTVKSVFPCVASYSSYVPVFADLWGFILASMEPIDLRPEPEAVDRLLAEKTTCDFRMFDGTTLLGLMQTPKHIRQAIATHTDIYTLADPPQIWLDE